MNVRARKKKQNKITYKFYHRNQTSISYTCGYTRFKNKWNEGIKSVLTNRHVFILYEKIKQNKLILPDEISLSPIWHKNRFDLDLRKWNNLMFYFSTWKFFISKFASKLFQ